MEHLDSTSPLDNYKAYQSFKIEPEGKSFKKGSLNNQTVTVTMRDPETKEERNYTITAYTKNNEAASITQEEADKIANYLQSRLIKGDQTSYLVLEKGGMNITARYLKGSELAQATQLHQFKKDSFREEGWEQSPHEQKSERSDSSAGKLLGRVRKSIVPKSKEELALREKLRIYEGMIKKIKPISDEQIQKIKKIQVVIDRLKLDLKKFP